MNANKLIASTLLAGILLANLGCNKAPLASSPACGDLQTISDPQKKAELERKCPRSGPGFVPSEPKKW